MKYLFALLAGLLIVAAFALPLSVAGLLAACSAPLALLALAASLLAGERKPEPERAPEPEPVEDGPEWLAWRDHLLDAIAAAAERDEREEAERVAEAERARQAFTAAHYAGVWYTTPEELMYLWSER